MTVSQQKALWRRQFKERLAALTPARREHDSGLICARLRSHPAWAKAGAILFFASRPDEPDLWPLLMETLQSGRQVALPFYVADQNLYQAARIENPQKDLHTGHYGIQEPRPDCPLFPLFQLDIILVPGVGFSRDGYRLGRGRGYYDRLLREVRGYKWGVAFAEQMADHLPVEAHDIRLDGIATPQQWLDVSKPAAGGT